MLHRILFFTLLAAVAWGGAARASCSQSHTFTTGEVLTAAILNANPAAEVVCVNNVDFSNIGAAGIYASQIIPTTVGQATFGSSQTYKFANGLNVTGTLAVTGSLTITASFTSPTITASTQFLGSILSNTSSFVLVKGANGAGYGVAIENTNAGGTGPLTLFNHSGTGVDFFADSGAFTIQGSLNNAILLKHTVADQYTGPEFIHLAGDTDTNDIAWYRNPSISVALEVFDVTGGNALFYVPTGGGIETTRSGSTTLTYVPPMYTAAGAVVAATAHTIVTTNTLVTTGSCASLALCNLSSGGTITFSNGGTFAGATTYACNVDQNNGIDTATALSPINISTTTVVIDARNISSGAISTGTSIPVTVVCTGT